MSGASQEPNDTYLNLAVSKKAKIEIFKDRKEDLLKRPSKLYVAYKWLLTFFFGCALLACVTFSKTSVIALGTDLHISEDMSNHNSVFVMLQMIVLIPYSFTFLRSLWAIIGRQDLPWPKRSAVIWVSFFIIVAIMLVFYKNINL